MFRGVYYIFCCRIILSYIEGRIVKFIQTTHLFFIASHKLLILGNRNMINYMLDIGISN